MGGKKSSPFLRPHRRRFRGDTQTKNDRSPTSRNFLQDRCSHLCRREGDWSFRHQRLSLDLIAGDYKNMGCRGELTSSERKNVNQKIHFVLPSAMPMASQQERLTCTRPRPRIFPLSWRQSRPSFAPRLLRTKIQIEGLPSRTTLA